ncbi:Tos1p Ecym_2568 [Eremothecium cymbalariae DBVPG|uniref:glucan endo-1,3-beta-D-glucosidase n=1 Tax=Eremothecium cymbalariae (strain CBS 270.75 / DBVPG 7215 / KCTC 17166 / NRRL Y-17582) TaxID=931890 RepID=G8JQC7_ERECY|nr:Hypothetical protein Ecym_2568 [Eremothecium cymbalariae DBVPG\
MKLLGVIGTALLAATQVSAECSYIDGNYYCGKTDAIVYANVGYKGTYMDVTNMDEETCQCTQESVSFGGSLSPLNEELSVHFRGPLKLLQFGVYYPTGSGSVAKRSVPESEADDGHAHHKHRRDAKVKYVGKTSTIFVGADGAKDSSSPTVAGELSIPSSPPVGNVKSQSKSSSSAAPHVSSSYVPESSSTSKVASASSLPSSGSGSGSAWKRVSYYTPGSTDNCTFFNYQGGVAGSGTWSSCFGNSISFAAEDGVSGASSATPLGDVIVGSNKEFIIMSGASCDDKSVGDCGYYRSKIPAYHGFGGASKMFVFEFSMPSDTQGSNPNQDMPAIWLLNAKIPRTLQYGDETCSCWKSGCGEMDLFEVLSSGSNSLITHLHDGQGKDGSQSGGGGTQDYFARPVSTTLKAAAIFDENTQNVHILEVTGDFGSTISAERVSSWLQTEGSMAVLASS